MAARHGFVSAHADDDVASQSRLVNQAILNYHGVDPVVTQRQLRFVYFTPSDRQPAAQYRERLTRVIEEMVQFYSQQIDGYGLKSQAIPLDRDADGLLRIVMVKGKEPWMAYNSKEYAYGEKIRNECIPALTAAGIDPEQETIAVFTAVMDWDESRQRFRQRSPYQGSGNARFGFCWQIDAPPLDPLHLTKKSPRIDDGEYGMVSIGKWNSMFVGGVIHELGHAFGLPHNTQRPSDQKQRGTSLMGNGNITFGDQLRDEGLGTYLTFPDAVRLVSHPLFSGSEKGLRGNEPRSGDFDLLQMEADGKGLIVSGKVSSEPATYAVIAYTDPMGGSDYDSIATVSIPNEDGEFQMRCSELVPGKYSELRLAALKVNGETFSPGGDGFFVKKDGDVDGEEMRQRLVLAPILNALRSGRHSQAASLSVALPMDEPAKALTVPLLVPPHLHPSAPDENANAWSLCDLRPDSARVGWRMPSYDYSPEDLLIRVNGRIMHRGIYAHANSSYSYTLDPMWRSFKATCAVSDGPPGTVVFVVNVDGNERWRSPVVRPGTTLPCQVDITGASALELLVEDGGDGNRRDHGYWLSPWVSK